MQRQWTPIKEYSDILFEYFEGIAKITINRPGRCEQRFSYADHCCADVGSTGHLPPAKRYPRSGSHRSRRQGLLLRGRHACQRDRRLHRGPQVCRGSMCSTCKNKIRSPPQTRHRHGERLCDRRRPCASSRLRLVCCERECRVRTDRAPRRFLFDAEVRGELSRPLRRTEEGARRSWFMCRKCSGPGSARDGIDQQSRAF